MPKMCFSYQPDLPPEIGDARRRAASLRAGCQKLARASAIRSTPRSRHSAGGLAASAIPSTPRSRRRPGCAGCRYGTCFRY